ncbi:MAG: MFS transporter [Anaerolineaceae bacterium]|nr:MFS transporter [Anaerolineaceae bacterium]
MTSSTPIVNTNYYLNSTTEHNNRYKWYILALSILTNMFVVAMPTMGMSVLSKEISISLNLSITQIGVVWGIGTLPGILSALFGGALGDKVGPKKILVLTSLLGGLIGASRGLADSYTMMVIIVLLFGIIAPVVTMNTIKMVGQWFPSQQLGLANGMISMGMALGFFLGSLLSATTLSPLLGGWQNVLILYGLSGAMFSIPWFFSKAISQSGHSEIENPSMRLVISHVIKQKDIWPLGLTLLGIGGCIQGILGYTPLYLRNLGWEPIAADGTLSAFHTISLIFVLPVAFWSSKLGIQKKFLFISGLLVVTGAGLLSFVQGPWVWVAMLLTGSVRDAFMAIYMTFVISLKKIGPKYAGTAIGLSMAISGIGNAFAPPLGNSLAVLRPGAPYLLWSVLAVFGLCCLLFVKQPVNVPDPIQNLPSSNNQIAN